MTEAERDFMHARHKVRTFLTHPIDAAFDAAAVVIDGLKAEVAALEAMRPIWDDPANADYGPRIALTQLWQALGVTNQTAAMDRIRQLRELANG